MTMMSNEELATAICAAGDIIRLVAPDTEVYEALASHLKALLVVQRLRAEALQQHAGARAHQRTNDA